MMRSRHRLLAAFAALAAMLFAQAAFALAACSPLQAQSSAHMIAHQAESPPCHPPADNANVCLTHCQAGEQTLDKHQVKVPEAPLHAHQVSRSWQDVGQRVHFVLRAPSPAAGPPPHIRFRSLLI